MRVEIIPNFATQTEITTLNNWVELGVASNWIGVGTVSNKSLRAKRLTSRFYGHRFRHPQVVIDLSTKVRRAVGVGDYPLIAGHGRDGVVVSYAYPGGDVYKHKDNPSMDGLATLRCNILTQKAETGGKLYIEGQEIAINVGDLHCYLVSEHEHWVTEVGGNTPRIMWMFGAHVPADDWNNGTIKVQR